MSTVANIYYLCNVRCYLSLSKLVLRVNIVLIVIVEHGLRYTHTVFKLLSNSVNLPPILLFIMLVLNSET